jgi:hypothetical protein
MERRTESPGAKRGRELRQPQGCCRAVPLFRVIGVVFSTSSEESDVRARQQTAVVENLSSGRWWVT